MTTTSSDSLSRWLGMFAYAASWLMLLVAPFPASAGLRGGLLLLAAIALMIVVAQTRHSRALAPVNLSSKFCVGMGLVWIVSVALFAAFGPDPRASLNAWRGDVLTPALACSVFYLLTSARRQLIGFSVALLMGVVVLSAMLVHDPFRPEDPTHAALYGGVGRVTMWFTTLAPLLPLVWLAPRRWQHVARLGCVTAVVAILVGTWFSGNRAAWISYAAMLTVGALVAIWSAKPRGISLRALLMLILLLVILGAGFYASSTYRANVHTNNSETPVEFLLKDNRGGIWRTAITMIEEKPWLGHGYDLDRVGDDFTNRLSDTRLRGFIRHGHNVLLDYAIQMGVFAAAILALLFVALLREFWRLAGSKKNERDQFARVAAICGVALMVGVITRNMVDDFFSRHMILLFGAMIGMLLGVANRRQNKRHYGVRATSAS